MQGQFMDQKDSLEENMATHSNSLAWRIPWTEEPGGLQSIGLQSVGHDSATEPTCTCNCGYDGWSWGCHLVTMRNKPGESQSRPDNP